MANSRIDSDPDGAAGPGRESIVGTPRWVWVAGIIALVVALLFGIMILTGGVGDHGPGRHAPPDGDSVVHIPPPGGHVPS